MRVASPWKHPDTGIYYFRRGVPEALRPLVGEREEKVSLETRDWREAGPRHAAVAAEVSARWERLRQAAAPKPIVRLTHKEAVALAGEVYRRRVAAHEADPGSSDRWRDELLMDGLAHSPKARPVDRFLARQRHRPAVETVLAERGIEVDAAGMATLIRLAAEAVEQADERLLRAAQGDYSPDPREARFPPIGAPQAAIVSLSVLFEPAWEAYLAERNPAAGTAKSYRGAMRNLLAFVGTDDIARVTEEDVRRWKAHLIERGLDPKTIKESKLAAVKSFYGWAVHEKRVEVNPATDVRMKVPKKPKLREREFNEREQKLILSATFAEPSRLISPEHAAVRRWVPWLCAYGGGRVNEMTQLRGQDIYEEDGVWVMRITPEAGTVKTGVARIVPLHPHLIDQGFLTFVRSRGKGPLFYSPARQRGGSAENPTYVRMGQKLAEWVRGLGVDDPNVDPNHGWRHLFKTRGRAAGIASDKLDALQGHAAGSVGAEYGSYPARVLMQEIVKLPRFDVTPAPSTDRRRREVRSVVQTPSQETS